MNKEQALVLHQEALSLADQSRTVEARFIEVITQIKADRVYLLLGYANLHQYCTQALRLSDAQSYTFMTVAAKAEAVPELKEKIKKGDIHLSNARRIAPILTEENSPTWLKKAAELSQRKLERELATEFPKVEPRERIRPISAERSELKLGISQDLESKLKRIKDLLSQKLKKPVATEEALTLIAEEFLKRNDPVIRAKRNASVARPNPVSSLKNGKRASVPASIAHQVALRDEGRCVEILPNGLRCEEARWVQKHHSHSVAKGGLHAVENFETLCQGHHRARHLKESEKLSHDQTWTLSRAEFFSGMSSPSSSWDADKRIGECSRQSR